jgi:hypothetical protein
MFRRVRVIASEVMGDGAREGNPGTSDSASLPSFSSNDDPPQSRLFTLWQGFE